MWKLGPGNLRERATREARVAEMRAYIGAFDADARALVGHATFKEIMSRTGIFVNSLRACNPLCAQQNRAFHQCNRPATCAAKELPQCPNNANTSSLWAKRG